MVIIPKNKKKAAWWKQSPIANRQSAIQCGSYQPPYFDLNCKRSVLYHRFFSQYLPKNVFFPKIRLWTSMDTKNIFKNILFC